MHKDLEGKHFDINPRPGRIATLTKERGFNNICHHFQAKTISESLLFTGLVVLVLNNRLLVNKNELCSFIVPLV